MHYGADGIEAGSLNKYDYACTAAACLAYLLLKQQDSCGLITFDEDVRQVIPPRSSQLHIDAVIKALHVSKPREKTDIREDPAPRRREHAAAAGSSCSSPTCCAIASRCSRGWRCSGTAGTTCWSSTSWTTTN